MSEQPDLSNSGTALMETIYGKIGLPEISGQQFVARLLLKELLSTLISAGILSAEQVDAMLAAASKKIEDVYREMTADTSEISERALGNSERAKEAADIDLKDLRRILLDEKDSTK